MNCSGPLNSRRRQVVGKDTRRPSTRLCRRGAIAILFLLALPVILAFSVISINVAWMQLTRTELRTSTDAAARAGSRTLSLSQDVPTSAASVRLAARLNPVAGDPLLLADADIEFGVSRRGHTGLWEFTARSRDAKDLNSVRVTGSREAGSLSGAVPMLFSGILDRSTFEPVRMATATHSDRDIVLVLDRSSSMMLSYGPRHTWFMPIFNNRVGSRWKALEGAVDVFLQTLEETRPNEMVGLVTYASDCTQELDMTMDYDRIRQAVLRVPYPMMVRPPSAAASTQRVALCETLIQLERMQRKQSC